VFLSKGMLLSAILLRALLKMIKKKLRKVTYITSGGSIFTGEDKQMQTELAASKTAVANLIHLEGQI
jgi:hypothetical protein